MSVSISFIVPAHNEERLLPATLEALHAAGRAAADDYEIIVVDDDSSDATGQIARDHGAVVVGVQHRQISRTRNSGAKVAKGDMFVFVDADTIVPARTLNAAIEALEGGAVGGGCQVRFDGEVPLYGRVFLPVLLTGFRLAKLAAGCFIFCTREAYRASGGYDESLYGSEEIGFSRALGRVGRFVILDEGVVTSGRKLRAYGPAEVAGRMFRLALAGPRALKSRDALDLWYGERREDPGAGTG